MVLMTDEFEFTPRVSGVVWVTLLLNDVVCSPDNGGE